MQIGSNSTSMEAGICVAVDKDGRDWCVVVVKGTFDIGKDGRTSLADIQNPMVYTDIHRGDPGSTSIRYECDFAAFKPRADVIVNGHAYAPAGKPVRQTTVTLSVGNRIKKQLNVIGDRRWEQGMIGLQPSPPEPFIRMPLLFERAFGGSDHSHAKPKYQGTELRNPIGVGFHKNPEAKAINGKPLPNIVDPRHPYRKWSDTPSPAGFGIIGRNWQPRIGFAGTYDEKWQNDRFPFLPDDFDEHYFLSAPIDQQAPHFKGGEVVQCSNMTADGTLVFDVPRIKFPVLYRFRDRNIGVEPVLDTMIIEPDERRLLLTWRSRVRLGRKLNALREVWVGNGASDRNA